MKKISIFLTIALVAIIYSCGNGKQGSNEQKADSLATENTKQVQNQAQPSMTEQEKAELYKYFSEEEIKNKLDSAMQYFSQEEAYFGELLKKDGFAVSPKELEKRWGKAIDKKSDKSKLDLGGGDIYDRITATTKFNEFEIKADNFNKMGWNIGTIKTETRGFGFAGIYVGVPECNKEYLLKLFKKFKPEEREEDGEKSLYINVGRDVVGNLYIKLDNNGLVKSVFYEAQTYVD